jgi:alpha-L-arabinofuranosidase
VGIDLEGTRESAHGNGSQSAGRFEWWTAIVAVRISARAGEHTNDRGKFVPPPLEEVHSLDDPSRVGAVVSTLLRKADRVRIGCLARVFNVIAAAITNNDGVLRQTKHCLNPWAIECAKGDVLDFVVRSNTYSIERRVPQLVTKQSRPQARKLDRTVRLCDDANS